MEFNNLKIEELDDFAVKHLIFGTNELGSILKAHLFIERIVDSMIEEKLENPNSFFKNQASFSLKIDLAHSLGVLPDQILSSIKGLNSIRNKYAHRLDYHVNEEDLNCLKLNWNEDQYKAFAAALKKGIEDATMIACLFLCWSLISFKENRC